MPQLVRLYVRSVLTGFALAAVFVGLVLGSGVGGLGGLVLRSDMGWLAVGMLWFFNGIVFAGVQFGIAVMGLAGGGGGGIRLRRRHAARPLPQPVAAGKGGGNRSNRGGVRFPRA